VGGDIYWTAHWGEGTLVALADCTGHGVPGAFMTLIATGALDQALTKVEPGESGALIQQMHKLIQTSLSQHESCEKGGSDDGLDMGACYIHPDRKRITFAGASFPLFVVENDQTSQIKGARKGVGYRCIPQDYDYPNTIIEVRKGMSFYMSTDGLFDQVGGEKRRGFGKKRFMHLLESLQDIPLPQQGGKIFETLTEHQGKELRRDDVAILGFKV